MQKSVIYYLAFFTVIYLGFRLLIVSLGLYHEPYFALLVLPVGIAATVMANQFVKAEKRAPTQNERDKLIWPALLIVILFYVSCAMLVALGFKDLSGFDADRGPQSRLGLVIVELLFGFFILIIRFDYTSRGLAEKLGR